VKKIQVLIAVFGALSIHAASAASVTVVSPSSSTGFDVTQSSYSFNYTLYRGNPSLWGNLQAGGFVEYTVSASEAGTYGLQLYYSTIENPAGTDISVNGSYQSSINLPSSGSWNAFQMSATGDITLPVGQSVIRVAAQNNLQPYNLAGLLVTPISVATAPTPTPTPTPTATPTSPNIPTTTVSPSATTGFDITRDSSFSGYTLYQGSPSLWGNLQAGGYVEFTISASAGNYALQLYYSTSLSGASANILVGGISQGPASLPSTGSWNTFQMSSALTIAIPSGISVLRIAAPSSYQAFNLQGMTLTPGSVPAPAPTSVGNYPLAGANFYVNPYSSAGIYAQANPGDVCLQYYPSQPNLLQKITNNAQGVWFGDWNTNVQSDAASVMSSAGSAVPILVVYNIPDRDCGGYSTGGSNNVAGYEAWVQSLARGIGNHKAAVVLEPDALSQLYNSGCLTTSQQTDRLNMLSYAVLAFKQYAPNAAVYLDAGHEGDSIAASDIAQRLRSAGVANAAGFALNTSNYLPTADNTTYGNQISALLGNKHFVIDTGRNGLGGDINNWCNVPNQGLGLPSQGFNSGLVDAYLWMQNPGESDGNCNGGPSAGTFWLQQACTLAHNAIFN
jgi:endoglucanase